jgi:hypothetical protein
VFNSRWADVPGAWADFDEELLALELLDLRTSDYDLSLTGFDSKEIDGFLLSDRPDEEAVPPLPVHPVTGIGDMWLCGPHRILCGDATDAAVVSRLMGEQKPFLMVTLRKRHDDFVITEARLLGTIPLLSGSPLD